ncbi:uncharacterized protein LOC122500030 isoform X12 [Leptopilina heterotoma]|uniref:uncharacterized protein LOC122500030 isoform X11 n=1 Tax=Leptopilina heterotoma TaxID=63436 RepID=UPI001CA91982|nr:uncharacterized protein LOC122500030 isoform X11 [Leptopilina heterotoma]XP_043464656.1 uncharacterized protein LOC122500030 isoform X12 [Leptopilina heterotoma]
MIVYNSPHNYFVIFFILTIWMDTVVISMDGVTDRDVPSGSNIKRENSAEDVIHVIDDDVPSGSNIKRENAEEGFRQLGDEGTTTSPKKWDIDTSFENLIYITNLHNNDPKIMTKELIRIILGENKLKNMIIQREKNSDELYSLIPEKVRKFVIDYVNLQFNIRINESTFKDAVNQLFNDIRERNQINEVISVDSSSSEEGNNIQSVTGENTTEDIKDVIYDGSPLRSYVQNVMDEINDDLTYVLYPDVSSGSNIQGENRAEDIMDESTDDIPSGSNIQGENRAEDIMDEINDDIPSRSNIQNTRRSKKLTDISSPLTKKSPTTRSRINAETTFFKRPDSYPYEEREGKVELLSNSGIWIYEKDLVWIKRYFKTKTEEMIRELLGKLLGEEILPLMIWRDGESRTIPQELKTSIFDFTNLNVNTGHKVNKKTYQALVLKILKSVRSKFKRGKTNPNDQKLKEPNLYPYQERGNNKVELLKGSNILIDKNELKSIKSEFNDNAATMIRLLLENLLGKEDMLSFTWGGRFGYTSIPLELKESIFEFINENVIPEQKKTYENYQTIVKDILRFKKKLQKGKPITDTQEHKTLNSCPYQKKGKNKVELLKDSKIWIPKNELKSYVKNFKNKPIKLITLLLESLIGKNNLKYFTIKGNSGSKRLPKNVKIAIFKFVNKHVNKNYKVTNQTFYNSISNFLGDFHRKKNEGVTLRPSGDSDINNSEQPPEEYPYQSKGAEKVELTKGSNIWIDEKKLKKYTTIYKNNPLELIKFLLKNLFGLENLSIFTWYKESRKYEQIPSEVKSAIMAYVNENVEASHKMDIKKSDALVGQFIDNLRRTSKTDIILRSKKQFDIEKYISEKPKRFPYQEKKGKIELVPESEVWIKKKEFKKLNEDSNITLAPLIRELLANLLGEENMKFFSLNGSGLFEPVPKNVCNAIYKFVKDRAGLPKNFSKSNCLLVIKNALMKSRNNLKAENYEGDVN